MKKTVIFAFMAVMALGMASCKKGQCSCIGVKSASSTSIDLMEEKSVSGYSDAMVCSEIMASYPTGSASCYEGKSMDEAREALKK